jgi:hypothetical protein
MELGDLACLEMELEKWRGQAAMPLVWDGYIRLHHVKSPGFHWRFNMRFQRLPYNQPNESMIYNEIRSCNCPESSFAIVEVPSLVFLWLYVALEIFELEVSSGL